MSILSPLLRCFFCLLLVLTCSRTAFAGDTLTIACIPYRSTQILEEQLAPLVELLSRKLERNVAVVVAENYKDTGEQLHHHVADIGILGPKSYVEAKEKYPNIRYLATNKSPEGYYHSLILVREDSGLRTLSDLQGKSFAYTEKGSTSGYLYPRQLFRKKGLEADSVFSTSYFLNRHDKVYAAIAHGAVDAGAVSSTGMKDAVNKFGDVFRVLSTSAPIPRNALVAAPHVSSGLFQQIQKILRTAEADPVFKQNSSTLPNKGFLIKDDSLYDIVREHQRVN